MRGKYSESSNTSLIHSPGPEVIKLFSCSVCSTEHENFPAYNVKIAGILTFISGKNSILGLSKPKESRIS